MKWGLCLSGGGIRGGAHIGVLKALEENGFRPEFITGTSAGAIVGGLYSFSYSPKDIEKIMTNLDIKKYIDFDINGFVNITDCKTFEAIRASIAIPGYFKPKEFRGHLLVDGGIRDNLPIDLLVELGAEKILVVNLGFAGEGSQKVHGIAEIAVQALDIMMYDSFEKSLLYLNKHDNVLIINPHLPDIKPLEFRKLKLAIERGYKAAQKELPKIKDFLQ